MTNVQVWRYVVQPQDSEGWGIFLLDSTGMFAAFTDYGNYCYKWTYHGCKDFRSFILDLSDKREHDYMLGKLIGRERKEYDAERTLLRIKEAICEQRRCCSLTKVEARTEFDRLSEYNDLSFKTDFHDWYRDQTLDQDAYEYVCNSWSIQDIEFCKKLLPRLAKLIRDDLAIVYYAGTVVAS